MVLHMKNYILKEEPDSFNCSTLVLEAKGKNRIKELKYSGSILHSVSTRLSHLQFSRDSVSVHQLK